MMKVIACLPVKGRLPLLAFTITRLLKKNGCSHVICAGDTTEEERVVIESGGIFVYHCNFPLGSKWNSAFVRARDYDPDACIFMGSSDFVSDNWIPYMEPYMAEYDMVGKIDVKMAHFRGRYDGDGDIQIINWGGYDQSSGRYGEAIGTGRMLGKAILEKIDYRPFDPTLDNSMDYSMLQKVNAKQGKVLSLRDCQEIQSISISCDEWRNKHNFLRESTYSTSTKLDKPYDWLREWKFEEAFEFSKAKRG